MGSVDTMITAAFTEMAMVDLSALPAASPTIMVPFTMFLKYSITGYWLLFK